MSSFVYWTFFCMVVKFYLTSLKKTPWQYTYVLYQHQNSVGVFVSSVRNTAPACYEYMDSNFSYQLFTFFGSFRRSARTERTDDGQRISEFWRFKSSGLWYFVVGRVDPDVSKERNPSFSASGGLLVLLESEDKARPSFEAPGAICPTTHHNVPEEALFVNLRYWCMCLLVP